MRDRIALALVRAELCRAHTAAQKQRMGSQPGGAANRIGPGVAPLQRALFFHHRGMRRDAPDAHDRAQPRG